MRHATIVGIFTVMLTLVSGLVFAEHVIDDSKNTGYLFVISGTSGSLDGDTLTLNGVPNVIYFSDRPARKAGHTSVTKFIDNWHKGAESVKDNPPNAVLSILDKDGNQNIVVVLQNPTVQGNNVSFKIKTLEGTVPDKFKASSLFIDPIRYSGPWTGT